MDNACQSHILLPVYIRMQFDDVSRPIHNKLYITYLQNMPSRQHSIRVKITLHSYRKQLLCHVAEEKSSPYKTKLRVQFKCNRYLPKQTNKIHNFYVTNLRLYK
jgi:hypothetical protein